MPNGIQLFTDTREHGVIKDEARSLIGVGGIRDKGGDRACNGNYAYVCFSSASNLDGAAGVARLGPSRYAVYARSDKELGDASAFSTHSESLLAAVWASVRSQGYLGLSANYVFTERVPCSDECAQNCLKIVESLWQVYFVATYERGWAYNDINANARQSLRGFYGFL